MSTTLAEKCAAIYADATAGLTTRATQEAEGYLYGFGFGDDRSPVRLKHAPRGDRPVVGEFLVENVSQPSVALCDGRWTASIRRTTNPWCFTVYIRTEGEATPEAALDALHERVKARDWQ